jgi:hypothetical protein
MLAYVLLLAGPVLALIGYFLPVRRATWIYGHRNAKRKRSDVKYRVDLPQQTRLLWACSVAVEQLPLALDERNVLILVCTPVIGNRLDEAQIDVPISNTDELNDTTVRPVSSALSFEETSVQLPLSVADHVERRFVAVPKVSGTGKVRFEFWNRGVLRGRVELAVKVRSKQYGPALPAGVALSLKLAGLLFTVAGLVLSFVLKLTTKR